MRSSRVGGRRGGPVARLTRRAAEGAVFPSLFAFPRSMLGGVADVTQILKAIEAGDPRPPPTCSRSSTTSCASSRPPGWRPRRRGTPSSRPPSSTRPTSGWSGAAGPGMGRPRALLRRRRRGHAPHPRRGRPPQGRDRHGGGRGGVTWTAGRGRRRPGEDLLALNEALDRLAAVNPRAADLVKLRYFAGLTGHEAAGVLNISPRKADQVWSYARAWLLDRLGGTPG